MNKANAVTQAYEHLIGDFEMAANALSCATIGDFDRWIRTDIYGNVSDYYERQTIGDIHRALSFAEVGAHYADYCLKLLYTYFNDTTAPDAKKAHLITDTGDQYKLGYLFLYYYPIN